MVTYKFDKDKFLPYPKGIIRDLELNKRYKLKIEIKGDLRTESWLVILKNPSKAGKEDFMESDKTVSNLCNYFYNCEPAAKTITVVNLFPLYLTDASKLQKHKTALVDKKNKVYIKNEILKASNIVLAWGTHPAFCKVEFDEMKAFVYGQLKGREFYQMAKANISINKEKPLHGQVWGYREGKYKLTLINPQL